MSCEQMETRVQDYLIVEETAEFLRVPVNTVYFYAQHRILPVYRPRKRLLFKRADLLRFIEDSRIESLPEKDRNP